MRSSHVRFPSIPNWHHRQRSARAAQRVRSQSTSWSTRWALVYDQPGRLGHEWRRAGSWSYRPTALQSTLSTLTGECSIQKNRDGRAHTTLDFFTDSAALGTKPLGVSRRKCASSSLLSEKAPLNARKGIIDRKAIETQSPPSPPLRLQFLCV